MIGRLTRDAELKEVGENSKLVMNFTVAVEKPYKNENGEKGAEFIPVSCWSRVAENLCPYMTKGKLVSINGHIHVRSSEDKEGKKNHYLGIIAEDITLLDSKKEEKIENL